MTESLRSDERIKNQTDFSRIYKEGQRYKGKYFIIIYHSNNLTFSRMAVVVSKRQGKSVVRNKIKRWAKEIFRRNKELIKKPVDIILIPKKKIQTAAWHEVVEDYQNSLNNIFNKGYL